MRGLNVKRAVLVFVALVVTVGAGTVFSQRRAERRRDRDERRPISKIKHIVFIVKEKGKEAEILFQFLRALNEILERVDAHNRPTLTMLNDPQMMGQAVGNDQCSAALH